MRERWTLGAASGFLGVLIVLVVIALGTAGHSSAKGCVDVSLPSTTGGAELYRCGAGARAMCASVGVAGGYRGAAAHVVAVQCRKAGLATG